MLGHSMKYITTVNDEEFIIEIDHEDEITVNGVRYDIDFQQLTEDGNELSLILNKRSLEAVAEERNGVWQVLTLWELYSVKVQDEYSYRLAQARGEDAHETGDAAIKSPMPGLIVSVVVEEGDAVAKGDKVVILESMKMENELRAPRDGVVGRISVAAGDSVEKGQVLAVIVDE
ncbi:MAG TPA: biotin/lipoyl-binding protein [Anaerolineae bacterium]|nr:biotin/lipoyl-binding protein [Anaerolineae bacterium]